MSVLLKAPLNGNFWCLWGPSLIEYVCLRRNLTQKQRYNSRRGWKDPFKQGRGLSRVCLGNQRPRGDGNTLVRQMGAPPRNSKQTGHMMEGGGSWFPSSSLCIFMLKAFKIPESYLYSNRMYSSAFKNVADRVNFTWVNTWLLQKPSMNVTNIILTKSKCVKLASMAHEPARECNVFVSFKIIFVFTKSTSKEYLYSLNLGMDLRINRNEY